MRRLLQAARSCLRLDRLDFQSKEMFFHHEKRVFARHCLRSALRRSRIRPREVLPHHRRACLRHPPRHVLRAPCASEELRGGHQLHGQEDPPVRHHPLGLRDEPLPCAVGRLAVARRHGLDARDGFPRRLGRGQASGRRGRCADAHRRGHGDLRRLRHCSGRTRHRREGQGHRLFHLDDLPLQRHRRLHLPLPWALHGHE